MIFLIINLVEDETTGIGYLKFQRPDLWRTEFKYYKVDESSDSENPIKEISSSEIPTNLQSCLINSIGWMCPQGSNNKVLNNSWELDYGNTTKIKENFNKSLLKTTETVLPNRIPSFKINNKDSYILCSKKVCLMTNEDWEAKQKQLNSLSKDYSKASVLPIYHQNSVKLLIYDLYDSVVDLNMTGTLNTCVNTNPVKVNYDWIEFTSKLHQDLWFNQNGRDGNDNLDFSTWFFNEQNELIGTRQIVYDYRKVKCENGIFKLTNITPDVDNTYCYGDYQQSWKSCVLANQENLLTNTVLNSPILEGISIYKKIWNYLIYTKNSNLYSYNLSSNSNFLLADTDFKQILSNTETETEILYLNKENKIRKVWFDGTKNTNFNSNMNQNCFLDTSYGHSTFFVQNDSQHIYCSSEKQGYISSVETSTRCRNLPQYCRLNHWYIFRINKDTGVIENEIPLKISLWNGETMALPYIYGVMSFSNGNKVSLYNNYLYFLDWRYNNENTYSGWNSKLYKVKIDGSEIWMIAYWELLQMFYGLYNNEFYMKSQSYWGQDFKQSVNFDNRTASISPPSELLQNVSLSNFNELNDSIKPAQSDNYNFSLNSYGNCKTGWVDTGMERLCSEFEYGTQIKATYKSDSSENIIYNNSWTEYNVYDYCRNGDLNCIYKSSDWQPIWNWWISNLFYFNKFLYLLKQGNIHNIKIFQ